MPAYVFPGSPDHRHLSNLSKGKSLDRLIEYNGFLWKRIRDNNDLIFECVDIAPSCEPRYGSDIRDDRGFYIAELRDTLPYN